MSEGSFSQARGHPTRQLRTAIAAARRLLKKIAAFLGLVDIVGIKLGMTSAQALAAIKAYKSTFKIEVLNTRLFHPGVETFTRVPRYISAQKPNNGKGYEYIGFRAESRVKVKRSGIVSLNAICLTSRNGDQWHQRGLFSCARLCRK